MSHVQKAVDEMAQHIRANVTRCLPAVIVAGDEPRDGPRVAHASGIDNDTGAGKLTFDVGVDPSSFFVAHELGHLVHSMVQKLTSDYGWPRRFYVERGLNNVPALDGKPLSYDECNRVLIERGRSRRYDVGEMWADCVAQLATAEWGYRTSGFAGAMDPATRDRMRAFFAALPAPATKEVPTMTLKEAIAAFWKKLHGRDSNVPVTTGEFIQWAKNFQGELDTEYVRKPVA